MTCRHMPGDPDCTSGRSPTTPDSERFEVLDAVELPGNYLVMKVQYPNCSACAYEGAKVMVFKDASAITALRWKNIDPHFRDPSKTLLSYRTAPSPVARFPASDKGWDEAIDYARWCGERATQG